MLTTEPRSNRKTSAVKNTVALFLLLFGFTQSFAQQDSAQNTALFLPLRVASLNVAVVSKSVQLQWTVSSNEDAKTFEIERADENGTFKKVGSKLAASHNGSASYEFVDALPKKNIALAYRVKIISKDGADVYSGVQSTRIEDDALRCKLKQNPVRAAVEVEVISPEAANLQTSIYTAYGQKVASETTRLSVGTNLLSFSSQNLLPGLHRLVLESGGKRTVISFVKE